MIIEIKMPRLGLTMKEGTVQEWYKSEGEYIEKGEVLCVIGTEKMTSELESPADGFLVMRYPMDEVIAVNTVIAEITPVSASEKETHPNDYDDNTDQSNEVVEVEEEIEEKIPVAVGHVTENTIEDSMNSKQSQVFDDLDQTIISDKPLVDVQSVYESKNQNESFQNTAIITNAKSQGEAPQEMDGIQATPLARKMAKKFGIDLTTIEGTGGEGRIVKDDVKKAKLAIKEKQKNGSQQAIDEPEVIQPIDQHVKIEEEPIKEVELPTMAQHEVVEEKVSQPVTSSAIEAETPPTAVEVEKFAEEFSTQSVEAHEPREEIPTQFVAQEEVKIEEPVQEFTHQEEFSTQSIEAHEPKIEIPTQFVAQEEVKIEEPVQEFTHQEEFSTQSIEAHESREEIPTQFVAQEEVKIEEPVQEFTHQEEFSTQSIEAHEPKIEIPTQFVSQEEVEVEEPVQEFTHQEEFSTQSIEAHEPKEEIPTQFESQEEVEVEEPVQEFTHQEEFSTQSIEAHEPKEEIPTQFVSQEEVEVEEPVQEFTHQEEFSTQSIEVHQLEEPEPVQLSTQQEVEEIQNQTFEEEVLSTQTIDQQQIQEQMSSEIHMDDEEIDELADDNKSTEQVTQENEDEIEGKIENKVGMTVQNYNNVRTDNSFEGNRVMKKLMKQPIIKSHTAVSSPSTAVTDTTSNLATDFMGDMSSARVENQQTQQQLSETLFKSQTEVQEEEPRMYVEDDIKDVIVMNKSIRISALETFQKQLHKQLQFKKKNVEVSLEGFITRAIIIALEPYSDSDTVLLFDGQKEKHIAIKNTNSVVALSENLHSSEEISLRDANIDLFISANYEELAKRLLSTNQSPFNYELAYKLSNDVSGKLLLTLLFAVNDRDVTRDIARDILRELVVNLENPMLLFL